MSLHAPSETVRVQAAMFGSSSLTTQAVFGAQASLMVATRPGGYHSAPHFHECEQLNLLQAGEIWVFVEDEAYHLRPGDFMRIPAGAVHWAWNRSTEACSLVEVHSPGLQADPTVAEVAVGLLREGESVPTGDGPTNTLVFVGGGGFDPSIAEAKSEARAS